MGRNRMFLLIGLGVALVIAGIISFYASSSPDGLEYTAGEEGFLDSARDSAVAGSPLADYGISGVENARLSVGLAGIIGVLVVLALATVLMMVLRNRSNRQDSAARSSTTEA